MRALAMAGGWVVIALSGCFGPYASDLDLPLPPPAPPWGHWKYDGSGAALDLNGTPRIVVPYRLTGHLGAEPNIGAAASGALFMTSYDETLRSRDGGQTWEAVFEFTPTATSSPDPETGDPMLWVDPVTDRVYTSHMYPSIVCLYLAWSEDEGESWDENPASCTIAGLDHQKFFTAPPGPRAPPIAGRDHPTVLFQCYQRVAGTPVTGPLTAGSTTHCNMSYDGGRRWPAETLAAARLPGSCGGVNGHPAVAPDGTVAIPITRDCDGLYVSVSEDSGLTWLVRAGPKEHGAESIDAELAFTPDGTLYALWHGTDHIAYLARSGDLGATWDGPWRVSPPHVTSGVFEALTAGDDGRIAMAFLGSDDSSAHPSDADENTTWHLYIVTSEDAEQANPTFTARQVTPEADPVQRGCVWLFGGGHPCRNMLDFIDSTVTPDGTFYVAFTKGCVAGCLSAEDKGSITAAAWLPGWRLRTPAAPGVAAVAGDPDADARQGAGFVETIAMPINQREA